MFGSIYSEGNLTLGSLQTAANAVAPTPTVQSPFYYDRDDGTVRRRGNTDPGTRQWQRYLETSFSQNVPAYPLDSPANNAAHYSNVMYMAIQTLMSAMSTASLGLEMRRTGPGGIPANSTGNEDDGYVPFEDHKLSDYLRDINPSDSLASFIGQAVQQYFLTGKLLIWGVPNGYNLPYRFYVLPTALCTPTPVGYNTTKYPMGAWFVQQYYPSGMAGFLPGPLNGYTSGAIIDAREVWGHNNPHPLYKWAAVGTMTGMQVPIDVLEMIDRSAWSVYRNGVSPRGIYQVPGAQEVEDIEAAINNKHAGPDNAGKIWVMGGRPEARAPTFTPLNADPQAMSYDTRAAYEGIILAAFGLDRGVTGQREGGSYAERWAAIQHVEYRTYRPFLNMLASLLSRGPVKKWGLYQKGVRAAFKLPKMDDPTLIDARVNAGMEAGIITTDESRASWGWGPDPLGMGGLPPSLRMEVLASQLQNGQLQIPAQPPVDQGEQEVDDPEDPSQDGTALGQLRAGLERPDGDEVETDEDVAAWEAEQERLQAKHSKPRNAPKPPVEQPAGGGSKKKPAKGKPAKKKRPVNKGGKGSLGGKKALPEDPHYRTEAVAAFHQHLLETPLDHHTRQVYADALDDAGAAHEAMVHRAIATVGTGGRPTDMAAASHDLRQTASYVAREATRAIPEDTTDQYRPHVSAEMALTRSQGDGRANIGSATSMHQLTRIRHELEAEYNDAIGNEHRAALHQLASLAHGVSEYAHETVIHPQRKALDGGDVTGTDQAGSLIAPPYQGSLPSTRPTSSPGKRRRRLKGRKARQVVAELVGSVMGQEVKALPASHGPDHEALVHSIINTAHLPVDDPRKQWHHIRGSTSPELGAAATYVANEMTNLTPVDPAGPHVPSAQAADRVHGTIHSTSPATRVQAHREVSDFHYTAHEQHDRLEGVGPPEHRAANRTAATAHLVAGMMHHSLAVRLTPRTTRALPESVEDAEYEVKAFDRYDTHRRALQNLPITAIRPNSKGANGSSIVTLAAPSHSFDAAFKPRVTERPELRPNVNGNYAGRESAASHVAQIVGVHDLVPATTLRTHLGLEGSIQKWIMNAKDGHHLLADDMHGDSHEDVRRAGAFDYLIGNSDRHPGNWLVKSTPAGGKLRLIDHGLSFPTDHSEYWHSTDLHREAATRERKEKVKAPAPTLVNPHGDLDGKWLAIRHALQTHGIEHRAITETGKRFRLLASGRHSLTDLMYNSPDDLLAAHHGEQV